MVPQVTKKAPGDCLSIEDVRNEIDNIDRTIIALIGQRFHYVKEVVKYKEPTAHAIEASSRRIAMLQQRREWAAEHNLSPDVIEDMYDRLVQYFINEEKKIAL